MDSRSLSDYEIRREGWAALTERLGIAGAMRFMMQYDPGYGDYTRERDALLADLSLDEAIRRMKENPGPAARPTRATHRS
jgi:hypothetical protein